MQLRKTWMLAVLSAMGMMMAACGGGRMSADLTCTTDGDCVDGEICHTGAKVCVQTCTAAADCPNSAKNCEAGAGETRLFCSCATTQLCQQDTRVDDASALSCNASKVCAPAGAAPSGCTMNSDCTSGQVCEAGACKAPTTGASCSGQGKTTCSYGQFCSSSKCEAVPVAPATCENFSKSRPEWSTSSNGPVIYSVAGTGYEVNSSKCRSGDAFLIRVRAYKTDADWPATRGEVAGFFYLTTGGEDFDVVNDGLLVSGTGYNRTSGNLKDAEFNLYLCRPSGSTTIQVGFYFTGGNPVCSQVNR